MAAIPEQHLWLRDHLELIEKLLLVIALGQPGTPQEDPSREDILSAIYDEVLPPMIQRRIRDLNK